MTHGFAIALQLLHGFKDRCRLNPFDAMSVTKGATPATVRPARPA
jgi:hypothetical protein